MKRLQNSYYHCQNGRKRSDRIEFDESGVVTKLTETSTAYEKGARKQTWKATKIDGQPSAQTLWTEAVRPCEIVFIGILANISTVLINCALGDLKYFVWLRLLSPDVCNQEIWQCLPVHMQEKIV